MKKIVIINSVYGRGSTGKICSDLAKLLLDEGNSVYIAYGRECVLVNNVKPIRIGSKISIAIHGILTRLFDLHGYGSFLATLVFLGKLNRIQPDAILLHNLHGYYINVHLLFKWLKKHPDIPVTWTMHDCWPLTGHCSHFDYINCDRWQHTCYGCPQKNRYPKSLLFDRSRRNHLDKQKSFNGLQKMTIITPSLWMYQLVRHSFLSQYNIKLIHNGIDLSVYTNDGVRYDLGLPKNKKIILCVSSIWSDRKGIFDIFKVARLFDESASFILVGKMSKELKNGLPDNIIHIEVIFDQRQLARLYASSNVFFNPTLEDTYPTVNLEALACGCPVVTYDTGGSPEMADPRFVVEKGNVNEAYKVLKTLLESEQNYSFPNRSQLSKSVMNLQYLELIHRIME